MILQDPFGDAGGTSITTTAPPVPLTNFSLAIAAGLNAVGWINNLTVPNPVVKAVNPRAAAMIGIAGTLVFPQLNLTFNWGDPEYFYFGPSINGASPEVQFYPNGYTVGTGETPVPTPNPGPVPISEVDIPVNVLQSLSLTGWDGSNPADSQTSSAGQTNNLYISESQNGTALLDLTAVDQTGAPNGAITYTIGGIGAGTTIGDFSNGIVPVILTPGDNEFTVIASEGNLSATLDVYPVLASLHIDSNNDGQITAADDPIKNDPTLAGKVLPLDDTDLNVNGIPDYADGYNLFGGADAAATGATFTEVDLTVSPNTDFANATFTFNYDASDPSAVTRTGAGTTASPYVYSLPANGTMRLWTKDGSAPRLGLSVPAGGNYIDPNDPLTASQLGLSSSNLTVKLYLLKLSGLIAADK